MSARALLAACCRHVAGRWRRDGRAGSAAIEFALIAPVFFLLLFGTIETGVVYLASATLQNAVNTTARQIRTGQITGTLTAGQLVDSVCGNITGLISATDCKQNLQVDLRAFSNFTGASYGAVTNTDGSINTKALTVDGVGACQVVLFRAFYPWTIMTPMMQPLLQNSPGGQDLLSGAAAFRTEPYKSGQVC